MYVHGKVTDTKGNPVPGAIIETWEVNGDGMYDNQVRRDLLDASQVLKTSLPQSTLTAKVQIVEAGFMPGRTARIPIELWCTLRVPNIAIGLTMALSSPVSYPIPEDGPVGTMIQALNRHIHRPAHIHTMVKVRISVHTLYRIGSRRSAAG